MENRTNKVLELENGKEYLVLRQILYKNETYYVTTEVINNGEDFKERLTILKEETKGNEEYLDIVTDLKTIKTIMGHLKKD